MSINLLPLEGYKVHQGEGDQLSYKGIALNPKEQVIAEKVQEIITYINTVEEQLGLGADLLKGMNCCEEEDKDKELEN